MKLSAMKSSSAQQQETYMRRRMETTAALMALGLALLMIRAIDLHWLQNEELTAKANKQHYRQYTVNAPRGAILDRNQRVLSESIEVPSIGVIAKELNDEALPKLAKALHLPEKKLARKIKHRRGFVWLARQVTPAQAAAVEALDITGVRIEKDWKRFHPLGPETGHILGFVGMDNHGLEGIERTHDKQLQGQEGQRIILRDARGHLLPGGQWLQQPVMGKSLTLTIDSNIQSIAYAALAKGVRNSKAKGGSAIVLNPHNGDILAMVNWPGYNPNNFRQYRPQQWRNRAITDVFEPGSTLKAFTVAAALESGKWHRNSRIFCEKGEFQVADYVIHDDHAEGWLTLTGVIQRSSNIGAAKLAINVGAKPMYDILSDLGFGHKSGIPLGGESSGILLDGQRWGLVETANIAFGQGIAVTPLQLAVAFGVLANDGIKVEPRIVLDATTHQASKRIMKASTARLVNAMLHAATDAQGTGFRAVPKGYQIAGKTGTAQKAIHGTYSEELYTAVFAGFAPVDKPAVVILVVVDEPQSSIYGGTVAAPVFKDIAASTLPYLGVAPEQQGDSQWQPLQVNSLQNEHIVSNHGFRGLSLREAYQLAEYRGFALKTHGYGWVEKQSPSMLNELRKGDVVEVWLNE